MLERLWGMQQWLVSAKANLGPSWKGREVSVSARVSEVPATYQQGIRKSDGTVIIYAAATHLL